jgi:tRNA A37 threonylcarbamoyladenosine modification protein TsaB
VGISFAKALAAARSIPLVAVGTLDVEAHPYLGLGVPVCAVIGAGKAKVYAATYPLGEQAGGGRAATYFVETHEGLSGGVMETTLLCGEAAQAVAALWRERLGRAALVVDAPPPTRRPGVLARLAYERLQGADTDDPETLQPFYMRGSQFESAQRIHNPG